MNADVCGSLEAEHRAALAQYGEFRQWADVLGVSPEEVERLSSLAGLLDLEFRAVAVSYSLGRRIGGQAGDWSEAVAILDAEFTRLTTRRAQNQSVDCS